MMRATSDSDVLRFAASSLCSHTPPRYFVQSPSTDSHDGEKYYSRATPVHNSPADSPSHPSYSRSSSSSRISGPFRFSASGPHDRRRRLNEKGWTDYSSIQEEIHYYGNCEDGNHDVERHTVAFKVFLGIVGFALICTVAGFVIWGLSRRYEPEVAVESLVVKYFHVGIGQDRTGVPTKLVSLNCTVNFNAFNPAPHFGIRVTSTRVSLLYSQIPVASTRWEEQYVRRKSHESGSVVLTGSQVPLYGAGLGLDLTGPKLSVPLTLKLDMSTQANVVWFLLKPRARTHIACTLLIDSSSYNRPVNFPQGTCTSS